MGLTPRVSPEQAELSGTEDCIVKYCMCNSKSRKGVLALMPLRVKCEVCLLASFMSGADQQIQQRTSSNAKSFASRI